jgi:acetoin utilization protein AcuB
MTRAPTLVREIMSTTLITVSPDADLGTALAFMSDYHLRRLPVVRTVGGETVVVGVITDRDLRLAAPSPFAQGDAADVLAELRQILVGTVMSGDVETVFPSAPAATAAQLMLDRCVGGLPVVEREDGRQYLVGIVTRSDLLRLLVSLDPPDAEPVEEVPD